MISSSYFQNEIHTTVSINSDINGAHFSSFSSASVCSWLWTIINFVFTYWLQTHTHTHTYRYTTSTYCCDFQSLRGGGRSSRLLRGTMPRAACITGKNFLYFILSWLFALNCLSYWNRPWNCLSALKATLICLTVLIPGGVTSTGVHLDSVCAHYRLHPWSDCISKPKVHRFVRRFK